MREVERTCQHYNTYPSDLAGPIPSWSVRLSNHSVIGTSSGYLHKWASNWIRVWHWHHLAQSSASFTSQVGYGVTRCNNTFDLALGMMKGHNQRELKKMSRGRQMHGWITHLIMNGPSVQSIHSLRVAMLLPFKPVCLYRREKGVSFAHPDEQRNNKESSLLTNGLAVYTSF